MRDEKEKIKTISTRLIEMSSKFCEERLNEEYKQLCIKLIEKMSRKRNVPFLYGKIEIWAAAIIYALGQINFLFDRNTTPYVKPEDICNHFGTSASTTSQKAKVIRDMFGLKYWHPEFSTEEVSKSNPMADMVMVDGMIFTKKVLMEMNKEYVEKELKRLSEKN